MKSFKIQTTNKEIYNKFNLLNFNDEVVFRNTKSFQIERIVRNINKFDKKLEIEIHPTFIIVKKIGNININANLRNEIKYL